MKYFQGLAATASGKGARVVAVPGFLDHGTIATARAVAQAERSARTRLEGSL